MSRSRPNISAARRLCFLGVALVASPVVLAGLAWACVPTARTSVSPLSGHGGGQITVSGSGFPAVSTKADVYLDTRSGTPLATGVPMSGGDEKFFSTQVTAPTTVGVHLLIPVPRDSANNDVGGGGSGAGPPAAVYQVTAPSLSASPGSGFAGSTATVTGAEFRSGTVTLHWDSADGPELGVAATGGDHFTFTKQVTIPASAAGDHQIVGVPLGDPSDTASTTLRVTPAPPPPPIVADTVGPAIAAAALTSANGTRTVSKNGDVTIFCGQFSEPGVSGQCGAKSAKKLKVAIASKAAVLKLAAKSFRATPGKPVKVRFRLKRASLRMLKRAGKVRMRGTVSARDAKGNASPLIAFRFTLRARE